MLIAKIENNAVVQVADYRDMFPNTSFPATGISSDMLTEAGCMTVTLWKDHDSATQKLVSSDPYIEDGKVYTVQVAYKTQNELDVEIQVKASKIRSQRNQLLLSSDWTQLADSTVDKTAWATYRQALRDITKQEGFPENVTWPNDPTVMES